MSDNMNIFTFGEPETVLSSSYADFLTDVLMENGTYYESPIDLKGLANLLGANAYHGPIVYQKKDFLLKWLAPSPYITRSDAEYAMLDFHTFGQCYFQQFKNGFGKLTRLIHQPRLTMRKHSKKPDVFVKLRNSAGDYAPIEFMPGEIVQIKEPDVKQKIYGRPSYIGGEQSMLLSEDVTLFRRRWYKNGAHMGFILVAADAGLDDAGVATIEARLKETKGVGNGRNMFIHIPKTNNKEPIKIIPIGDIGSKDDIDKIMSISKDAALAMHRMPPELVGIIPTNTAGFGDREKALKVYHEITIEGEQNKFLQLNEEVKAPVFRFIKPDWGVSV